MSDGQLEYIVDETGGRLGRNVLWHDPSNRAFPARGKLFAATAPIIRRSWWCRHLFDQGYESSCTMQASAGVLHTSPNRLEVTKGSLLAYDAPEERYAGYRKAQLHDPWTPEGYEGSSTDAPFKVLREEGHILEWRWCFGLDDVLRTLSHHGPVAIGTNWHEGMETPRARDALIEAVGEILGGHATELYAVAPDTSYAGGGYVDGINSWGEWGPRRGRFRMSWATLQELLEADGEAVTVV